MKPINYIGLLLFFQSCRLLSLDVLEEKQLYGEWELISTNDHELLNTFEPCGKAPRMNFYQPRDPSYWALLNTSCLNIGNTVYMCIIDPEDYQYKYQSFCTETYFYMSTGNSRTIIKDTNANVTFYQGRYFARRIYLKQINLPHQASDLPLKYTYKRISKTHRKACEPPL